MKSHRPIPLPDTASQESKKSTNQMHKQSQNNNQQLNTNNDYQKITVKSEQLNANNIWHNPTRLRPP